MEYSSVWKIFENPLHPYTKGLMRSLPKAENRKSSNRLYTIPGTVPSYAELPKGCLFYGRCDVSMDICAHEKPRVSYPESNHMVRCWRYAS
jgi:peptide/nickel transport system ATP-binding protein/oligopeptide transport system ATP-binding protein